MSTFDRAHRFLLAGTLLSLVATGPLTAQDPEATPVPGASRKNAPPPTGTITGPPQSLGDIARQSKESKESKSASGKSGLVITNESLKKGSSGGSGSVSTIKIGKPTPAPAAASSRAAASDTELRDLQGNTESSWRQRAKGARDRVAAAEASRKRLETESKRLENDFYAWSDGSYRDRVIKPAWEQARAALKASQAEYEEAKAAYAGLEEEARKAGAPPGWLR